MCQVAREHICTIDRYHATYLKHKFWVELNCIACFTTASNMKLVMLNYMFTCKSFQIQWWHKRKTGCTLSLQYNIMHDTSGCQVHLNAQILEQKKNLLICKSKLLIHVDWLSRWEFQTSLYFLISQINLKYKKCPMHSKEIYKTQNRPG